MRVPVYRIFRNIEIYLYQKTRTFYKLPQFPYYSYLQPFLSEKMSEYEVIGDAEDIEVKELSQSQKSSQYSYRHSSQSSYDPSDSSQVRFYSFSEGCAF